MLIGGNKYLSICGCLFLSNPQFFNIFLDVFIFIRFESIRTWLLLFIDRQIEVQQSEDFALLRDHHWQ